MRVRLVGFALVGRLLSSLQGHAPLAEIPQMALPDADDGGTNRVRTTLPVVDHRGRSGSVPYQADLAFEDPSH